MTVLLATDLDRTLIYSRTAAGVRSDDLVCVEHREGEPASFMTPAAARQYEILTARATIVPVTTRSPEQYARVQLPGVPQRFAVVANGAVLMMDGGADAAWQRRVDGMLADAAPLAEVQRRLAEACAPDLALALRTVGKFFCYAVVDRPRLPDDLLAALSAWAGPRGWRVSLQGRKLYCVPAGLRKGNAVLEIARRVGAHSVLAAGDALLDVDLLLAADRAIRPAHGELHELGWTASTVACTDAAGAAAGEEIVTWFAAQCDVASSAVPVRGR
jgi:hydroxymethylpyrimidine pyrophosphatase-like HAD family hydrolase